MTHEKPLIEVTIGDMLDQIAQRQSDNECVVAPEYGVRWSWKEFSERTDRIARGLMAMGIQKGEHVAIWATNVPEWILLQFATAKMGAVLVTVNTNYKQFELEYLLRQSDTTSLFMIETVRDNSYVQHVRGLCPDLDETAPGRVSVKKLPFLKNLVFIGPKEKTPAGFFHFDQLYYLAENISPAEQKARQASLAPHY